MIPAEVRLDRAARLLVLHYPDGTRLSLPAEYLRVESPSAEVQGHSPAERRLVHGRRHVGIATVEPVGRYALRLLFDDGHDTGLYTWEHLAELGREHDGRWATYLAALEAGGLSRDA